MELAFVPGSPRLAYVSAGRGSAVVFLHGIGGNRSSWTENVVATALSRRAIAWDARGYGDSEGDSGVERFADFAVDLERMLDHLEISICTLVGLSMGARIALEFFARAPKRVHGLMLCSCAPSLRANGGQQLRDDFVRRRLAALDRGEPLLGLASQIAASLVGPNCAPAVRARLEQSIAAARMPAYRNAMLASTEFDRSDLLAHIEVPVMLVYGEYDRLTPSSIGHVMHQQLPRSRLEIIADAGHVPNLEQPHAFARALASALTWIDENRTVR